jgi:hypothetical protein
VEERRALCDGNTAYFHKLVKTRNSSTLVKSLRDERGNLVQDFNQIKQIAISFYQTLLGTSNHSFSSEKAARVSSLVIKNFPLPALRG